MISQQFSPRPAARTISLTALLTITLVALSAVLLLLGSLPALAESAEPTVPDATDQALDRDFNCRAKKGDEKTRCRARKAAAEEKAAEDAARDAVPYECPAASAISISTSPAASTRTLKSFDSDASPHAVVNGNNRPHPGYTGFVGNLDPEAQVVLPQAAQPPRVEEGRSPLTGLKTKRADDPAVVVKVSNSVRARPQTGLHKADIVIEEQVEGGITRFLGIFQSQTSVAGPVRSVRSTDVAVVTTLRTPAFLYSGGNSTFVDLIRQTDIDEVSEATCPQTLRRVNTRSAPHNLYARTGLVAKASNSLAPKTQFRFRENGEKVGGTKVSRAQIAYSANLVDWQWHPRKKVWQRWQGGRPHTVTSGAQISAENVIIVELDRIDSGVRDGRGAVVTEDVYVGKGRAVILTQGRAILARWNRPSLDSVTTFVDRKTKKSISITPGNTWIQLAETGEYDFG